LVMNDRPSNEALSEYLVSWLVVFLLQQFALIVIAAPAVAAGSITEEKTRGSLQDLLITDLESWEIILGKWLAHVTQLGITALAGLPLFLFVGVLAGLTLVNILLMAVHSLLPLAGLAAVSLLASVWCRKTTTAVLVVYVVGGGILVGFFFLAPSAVFQPAFLFLGVAAPSDLAMFASFVTAAVLWAAIIIPCLTLAAYQLRSAHARQLEARPRRVLPGAARPPVSDRPLRWKERYLGDAMGNLGSRWLSPRMRLGSVFTLTTLISVGLLALYQVTSAAAVGFLIQGLAFAFLASSIIGIRCAGAISGERERQTWDGLLVTPLATRQLVRAKLWGIIDAERPYLLAYTIPAVILSPGCGVLAVFWTILAWLATWIMMYFMGASGIDASARSQSSWRSLVGALAYNARAVVVAYLFVGVPLGALSLVVGGTVVFVVVSMAAAAVALFAHAEELLQRAEKHIATHDRTLPAQDDDLEEAWATSAPHV
jgi:ABC-type transport system involved in multi-copper enzyme maturation permease subunit